MKYIVGFLLLLGSVVTFGQKEIARPDIPGDLMIDIGLNFWDEEPLFVNQRAWRSKSIGFYYTKRKSLGNKFGVHYGAGLGLEKIDLGDSLTSIHHSCPICHRRNIISAPANNCACPIISTSCLVYPK